MSSRSLDKIESKSDLQLSAVQSMASQVMSMHGTLDGVSKSADSMAQSLNISDQKATTLLCGLDGLLDRVKNLEEMSRSQSDTVTSKLEQLRLDLRKPSRPSTVPHSPNVLIPSESWENEEKESSAADQIQDFIESLSCYANGIKKTLYDNDEAANLIQALNAILGLVANRKRSFEEAGICVSHVEHVKKMRGMIPAQPNLVINGKGVLSLKFADRFC